MYTNIEVGKRITIIISLIFLIIAFELIIVILHEGLKGRTCPAQTSFDKKNIGCTGSFGKYPLNGTAIILTVKQIVQDQGETYAVVDYPLFFGLTLPMRLRAGHILKYEGAPDRVINACKLIGSSFNRGYVCRLIQTSRLNDIVRPRSLVAVGFFSSFFLSNKNEDLYLKSCEKVHVQFLSSLAKKGGFISFLPFFGTKRCAPVAGQIFYK